MREEYEEWFIGKFVFPPMPIHSRVLDFCWVGYQAGRKNSESEIAELLQQVTLLRDALLEISQVACSLSPEQKTANKALAATEPNP